MLRWHSSTKYYSYMRSLSTKDWMYSRSLEIYWRGAYSLYLQWTYAIGSSVSSYSMLRRRRRWTNLMFSRFLAVSLTMHFKYGYNNNSSIKDIHRITDSRPCTKVSVIQRVHCSICRELFKQLPCWISASLFAIAQTFQLILPLLWSRPTFCTHIHVYGTCIIIRTPTVMGISVRIHYTIQCNHQCG